MEGRSIVLFGAQGYVGGTIATVARAHVERLTEIGSKDFSFWDDVDAWPSGLLQTPTDTVIIAASFEKPVSHGNGALEEELRSRFRAFIGGLCARRIIFLSSDAVFDGTRGPYPESDALSPITSYGRCKAIMESIVADHANAHIVRMSVVWGEGSTKPDARRRRLFEQCGERYLGATNVFRSPIEVSHLARAIVRMASVAKLPGILHLATPRMSYRDFLRMYLLPEVAGRIDPWVDPSFVRHDTSLMTTHQRLVDRLLAW